MKKTKEQIQEILVEMAVMESNFPKATIIYNFKTNSITLTNKQNVLENTD